MSVFSNFIGDNAFQVDALEAEENLREKYPLLLHEKESVELAFKDRGGAGRDKSFFTSHRILIKDGKGIGSKRRNYLSIPYTFIEAFSIETAGTWDGDIELKVWSKGEDAKLNFARDQVDIFAVQQFMNKKVNFQVHSCAGPQDFVNGVPVQPIGQPSSIGNFLDWIGDNARQLQPWDVEQRLKKETPILVADEKVELAFRAGRDSTVFTNKRLLIVDVQGFTGKRIEFLSIKWSCISGFAVETAGAYFDRDTEMTFYTSILGYQRIKQDFRKGKADVFAVQKYLCNKILGEDTAPMPEVDRRQGHVDPKTSWWFRSDQRPLDAVEMNQFYHTSPPILQGNELLELAFKGRRDITLFTTKRLLIIDPKGWKGVKIEYTSVPWKSVLGFGAKTAGKHFDRDAEVMIWTDMMFFPGAGDDPDEPGMSFLELDFNKNLVNVIMLKKYLSARCLQVSNYGIPIPPNVFASPEEKGFEKFLSKIGDDQRAIDPTEINRELHTTNPVLLENENIVMAFKSGRDLTLFTNLRVIIIDVQGWSGQKIEYTSIPYTSIRAFSAESAGGWDRDSEVDLYTRNLWTMRKIGLDFRKGKADIIAIQKFLSAIVIGSAEDAARYFANTGSAIEKSDPAGLGSFVAWINSNAAQQDAEMVNFKLHSDPPILLEDECVIQAFKQGRDMKVYTDQRVLIIDVQGLQGKKVEYKSFPLKWCTGLAIETAGHLDPDAEAYVYTDVPAKRTIKLSLLVRHSDIYEMHMFLSQLLIFGFE